MVNTFQKGIPIVVQPSRTPQLFEAIMSLPLMEILVANGVQQYEDDRRVPAGSLPTALNILG